MKNRELKEYLRQSLGKKTEGYDDGRLKETVQACIGIMREQNMQAEEPRLNFWGYLSAVFRFDGIPIFALQAMTLFLVCLVVRTLVSAPESIPVFVPLFVLAAMPVLFRGRYYGMSEIEAATRSSGAQIMLVRLILAGAANLLGMTGLLGFEIYQHHSGEELGQMILYCLVPYLVCMVIMLRMLRLRKDDGMAAGTVVILGSCVFWGILAKAVPWLYQTSAAGFWIAADVLFTVFFLKEIYFIIETHKEGKMYGTVA